MSPLPPWTTPKRGGERGLGALGHDVGMVTLCGSVNGNRPKGGSRRYAWFASASGGSEPSDRVDQATIATTARPASQPPPTSLG